jgi:hypothetical protein
MQSEETEGGKTGAGRLPSIGTQDIAGYASLLLLLICIFSAAAYFGFSDEIRFFLNKLVKRAAQ